MSEQKFFSLIPSKNMSRDFHHFEIESGGGKKCIALTLQETVKILTRGFTSVTYVKPLDREQYEEMRNNDRNVYLNLKVKNNEPMPAFDFKIPNIKQGAYSHYEIHDEIAEMNQKLFASLNDEIIKMPEEEKKKLRNDLFGSHNEVLLTSTVQSLGWKDNSILCNAAKIGGSKFCHICKQTVYAASQCIVDPEHRYHIDIFAEEKRLNKY